MKATIYTNDFNRIVQATKQFCSIRGTREPSRYIRLEFRAADSIVTAIAVDGFRMSVEHAVISDCDDDFDVYVKSSIKLPAKKYAEISLDGDEVTIRCDGNLYGFQQPHGDFLDWEKALPDGEPSFRIAFNGNYLLSALQAAKASNGNSFRSPIVLEFRSNCDPVIVKTNKNDIKMVLPLRMKEGI